MKKQLHSFIIILIVIFFANILGLTLHAQDKQKLNKKNLLHQTVPDTKDLLTTKIIKSKTEINNPVIAKTIKLQNTASINAKGYCVTAVNWYGPYTDPEDPEWTYDREQGGLFVIDAAAGTVRGPVYNFNEDVFDVVVTPNNRTAVVSCFGESKVYFFDLTNPLNPVFIDTLKIDFFAEDMDISPDGKYLLITDGGFTPRIASVDIESRTIVEVFRLGTFIGIDEEYGDEIWEDYGYANAVDISPDGQTVLAADYFSGTILVLLLNPSTGQLTFIRSIQLNNMPVNVCISPNGKTAITANFTRYISSDEMPGYLSKKTDEEDEYSSGYPEILRIDAPGVVSYQGEVPVVWSKVYPEPDPEDEIDYDLIRPFSQSIVFSQDSKKAYLKSWNAIYELNIISAGVASTGTTIPTAPIFHGTSGLFGVDVMDIDMSGRYLYFGNHTLSGGKREVGIIDLNSNTLVGTLLPAVEDDLEDELENIKPVSLKFFTAEPIVVQYPNGGEILPIGSTTNIRWSANLGATGSAAINSSSSPNYVKIEFSTNGGSTWNIIKARNSAASGTYPWTVPNTPATHCLVRVSKFGNPNVYDVSNNTFTIGTNTVERMLTVWPGDANNDGVVNYDDFNAIKQYENKKGTSRPGASTNWVGQEAVAWIPAAATYADCNGDGVVNSEDFYVVLNSNWGKTHSLGKENEIVVSEYNLLQNFPNPFNPSTQIQFELPEVSRINLIIYNTLGQEVATLINDEEYVNGIHQVEWIPNNLASGIYIYRMTAQSLESNKIITIAKKMQYLR